MMDTFCVLSTWFYGFLKINIFFFGKLQYLLVCQLFNSVYFNVSSRSMWKIHKGFNINHNFWWDASKSTLYLKMWILILKVKLGREAEICPGLHERSTNMLTKRGPTEYMLHWLSVFSVSWSLTCISVLKILLNVIAIYTMHLTLLDLYSLLYRGYVFFLMCLTLSSNIEII